MLLPVPSQAKLLVMTKIQEIQLLLGVEPDDNWGPKSQAALDHLIHGIPNETTNGKNVMASSFADPADVAAFRKCKAQGNSDEHCFKVGDNGIGKWGDDTTLDSPMCALPPEDWQHLTSPRGQKVEVTANGHTVIAELRDTMPHKANITNGCGIDMNPALCDALSLFPPVMTHATWRFI